MLARVLQTQIVDRTLADEGQAAQLIARIGIQPRLGRKDLCDGLSAAGVGDLDRQLRTRWVTDSSRAIGVLEALRETGVGISIDDFGTGNASIQYLAKLPASEIKIDRSFVAGVCEDPRAEAIVRSTVDLARHFRLQVVAEGIETGEALERLAALGCDAGQGYLISRPLPAEELTAKLTSERAAASR